MTNTSKLGFRIWDVADYVIPAQEENSVFIMTNMVITMNQTQGFCPEIPGKTTVCETDANCTAGSAGTHSSGVATGRCVSFNGTLKTCEVAAWCPVEDDTEVPKPAFLKAAENFTLLVKNNIWYPKFNFSKRNILPNITTAYLKTCIYDAKTDPFCPIFRLGKIVEYAGHSFQDIATEGGIMGIQIKWNCNLDRAASFCLPRYSFRRLDTRDTAHNVSPGYNFRFAKYYSDPNGAEHRTLIKAYGIRFDIIVFGKAGKFDIIPTMINIGSGLALLGVATVLCDVIVLYCMKKRYYYREKKYKYVEDYEQVGCLLNSQQAGRPKRLTSPASCTSGENPVHLGVLSTQAVTHHFHHPLHFWTICTNICFILFFRWTHPLKSSLRASLVAQLVKNLPAMQETWVRSLG
ncbi:P2X purinoceptor 4 isoform X2 [Ovis aries]|nr:P2X purinoceptor 4 isoform X2 [Ovis aries]